MSNGSNPDDPEEHKAALRRIYQSVPALDPPQECSAMMRDVYEEVGLRGALSGLPRDSPAFRLYSERLAEFLGVSVAELDLSND